MLTKKEKKVLKGVALIVLIAFFIQTGPVYAFYSPMTVAESEVAEEDIVTTEQESDTIEATEEQDTLEPNSTPELDSIPKPDSAATEYAEPLEEEVVEENVETFLSEELGETWQLNGYSDKEIVGEVEEKREKNAKVFLNSDNSMTATLYDHDVHYRDETGQFVEIDNTLSLTRSKSGEKVYSNKANALNVSFAQNALSEQLVSLENEGYTLSWSLANTKTQPKTQYNDAKIEVQNDIRIDSPTNAKINSQNEISSQTELKAPAVDTYKEKTAVDSVNTFVAYQGIQSNIDLQYDLTGNILKESIVLNEKSEITEFSFLFNAGELQAKESEDGMVLFNTPEGKTIFWLHPSVMFDDADGYSEDIKTIIEPLKDNGSGNQYLVTLKPSLEWLQSEERVYPIIIDPLVSTEQRYALIQDTYASSAGPNGIYSGETTLRIGQSGTNGSTIYRSFIKFTLPDAIKSSDRVVYAELDLYPNAGDFPTLANKAPIIEAHEVTSSWTSNTLNWNNQPSYNSRIIDYEKIGAKDGATANRWYSWDITELVDRWYTDKVNNGLMLKYDSETSYGANMGAYFASSECGTNAAYPIVYISYMNMIGLEDYWTYHQQEAGLAGTGYINDFNGEFTANFSDCYYDSDRMPFALSHVYNSGRRTVEQSTLNVGKGWRLSIQESVAPITLSGTTYYQYIDGDGTEHYFKQNGSVWEDGSGLELKLAIGTSTYTITDKKNNVRTFNKTYGYLTSIKDSNGNQLTIQYTSNKITSVTDCANRKITFNASNGRLSSISLPDGRTVSYIYDSSGFLTRVAHPGTSRVNTSGTSVANSASYNYNNNVLVSMTDNTKNRSVVYSYYNWHDCFRVIYFYTITSGSSKDTHYDIAYGNHATTFTEAIPSVGRKEVYIFNSMGQTVSVYDQDDHAIFYKLGASGGAKNKITFASDTQRTITNLMQNHSFEEGVTGYTKSGGTSDTIGAVTTNSLIGQNALRVYKASNNTTPAAAVQSLTLKGGKKYTLSAYVKTTISSYSLSNSGAYISLEVPNNTSLTRTKSAILSESAHTRHAVTVDLTGYSSSTNVNVNVQLGLVNTAGNVYFDCVQLEEGDCANRYNIIKNGGLEAYDSWAGYNVSSNDGDGWTTSQKKSGGMSYHIVGKPKVTKRIYQTVPIYGKKGEGVVCGVWVKTNGVPNKDTYADGTKQSVGITLELKKQGSTTTSQYESILFTPTNYDWQYISLDAIAQFDFSDVLVHLKYAYNANDVYFDDVQLFKDSFGESFTYDSKGNVTTVVDMAKNTQNMVSNATTSDLTSYKDGLGYEYKFTYDGNHNLKTSTAPDGTGTNLSYATYGQLTETKFLPRGGGDSIIEQTRYTNSTDSYKKSTVDQRGLTTSYSYDPNSGLLKDMTEPLGSGLTATTTYGHDTQTQRLTNTSTSHYNYRASYGYYNGNLTNILFYPPVSSLTTLEYTMTYDDKDNLLTFNNLHDGTTYPQMTNNYSYGDGRSLLKSTQYGNGQTLTYTYDKQDRIIKTAGTNTNHQFFYNANGSIGKSSFDDGSTSVTTWFDYDFAARLVGVADSRGFSVSSLKYDKNNIATGYTSSLYNTKTRTSYDTAYQFNNVNQQTRMTVGATGSSNPLVANPSYDAWGRLSLNNILNGSTDPVNNGIWIGRNYLSGGTGKTTTMLNQYRTRYTSSSISGQNADEIYDYTFDDFGNIKTDTLTLKNGTASTATYTYTNTNYLSGASGRNGTHSYTYDNLGNITKKVAGGTTYTYAYDRDMLQTVKQGTQTIATYTYDAIGNPTSIVETAGTKTLTWTQGKLLRKVTRGSTLSNTYSYNENDLPVKVTKYDGSYVEYYYNNQDQLEYELRYNSSGTLTRLLKFYYDSDGNVEYLLSKADNFNNANAYNLYYYLRDGLENITGLIKVRTQSGTSSNVDSKQLVATYTYDPYGKILTATAANGSTDDIYQINPIRYKGYYYDSDLAWYRLTTRYYDPNICRFINRDDVSLLTENTDTLTDKNLYAYCDNNPINRKDANGEWAHIIIGAVLGAAFEAASQLIENGRITSIKAIGISAATGAVTAAFGPAGGTIASGLGTFASELVKGKSVKASLKQAAISAVAVGGISKAFNKLIKPVTKTGSIFKKPVKKRITSWAKGQFKQNTRRNIRVFSSSMKVGVFLILKSGIGLAYKK